MRTRIWINGGSDNDEGEFRDIASESFWSPTKGNRLGANIPTPSMAKLLKNPNVMIEKSSMGINIVERASAPTDSVNPMDTAVIASPITMGPVKA